MKKLFLFVLTIAIAASSLAQHEVKLTTNLNQLYDGKLMITVYPPAVETDTLVYAMPKIVPGTYSVYNFGKMISEVAAYDKNGKILAIKPVDQNRWVIYGAAHLHRIVYYVAPTFTDPAGKDVFEPAGTRFEEGLTFLLNSFAMAGYFEGYSDADYEFEIIRQPDFYGATALKSKQLNDTTDVFYAKGYFDFHDSPIMYSAPDTASFMIGETDIQIAVYSPGKALDAAFVKSELQPVMKGAARYLGGTLPVEKYVVLISLMQGAGNSGGFGALEHFYSTVFVMPEFGKEFLARNIRDVVAHEFFHIVTPLNIHSEHIHNYDFGNPVMSRHLWLYEGGTEYAAHHMQVVEGLLDRNEFLSVIRQKIVQADSFDDELPFTELSLGALDEHKGEYMNVYLKGTLINMCLDLLLCDLSEGEMNLPQLMAMLSERYGADKPFQDDKLFDVIAEMTYPEVREFFRRYVEGPEPLPMTELLAKAGVEFDRDVNISELTLGGFLPGVNKERNRMEVVAAFGLNEFGRELGIKKGDVLISINGIDLEPETFGESLELFRQKYQAGDKVTLIVERQNEKGQWKTLKLKASALAVERNIGLRLRYLPEPGNRELKIRKAWINQ